MIKKKKLIFDFNYVRIKFKTVWNNLSFLFYNFMDDDAFKNTEEFDLYYNQSIKRVFEVIEVESDKMTKSLKSYLCLK